MSARTAATPHPDAPYSKTSFTYPPRTHLYKPVPSLDLFARYAPPLSLPALDALLAAIPAPEFTVPRYKRALGKRAKLTGQMFSPMDMLLGRKLDDLSHNAKITPDWRNRNTVLASLVNIVLGLAGSSAISNYYSLQGIIDSLQIFALVLSSFVPNAGRDLGNTWRKLFLGTIPNILALSPTVLPSLTLYTLLLIISLSLLTYFHFATRNILRTHLAREGIQGKPVGNGWGIVMSSFALTVVYLPVGTISLHAIIWSSDFWPVANPYTSSTFPPAPLGPSSEFRGPLDFCYTTTMKKDEFNFAPFVVILSLAAFLSVSIYFPLRLAQTIRQCLPIIDPYTELGKQRTAVEMEHEYQRMLARDREPLSFLYNAYRRPWGTYKSLFLTFKLSALLITSLITPSTCLLRSFARSWASEISVARQSILAVTMFAFFLVQCFAAPFVDPVNNASEWFSRLSYMLTAIVGLLAALNVKGTGFIEGPVLYCIYGLTYSLNIYFTVIDWSWMRRLVKRMARRVDFSIDIFSPHLDISPNSPHTKRRIWQESLTTLFLTSPECRIPPSKRMVFAEASDLTWPPYLLDFGSSPSERHVENLKILRDVGHARYHAASSALSGPLAPRLELAQKKITNHFVGPDSYWNNPTANSTGGGFGNSWWIPFPPTLVVQYDAGPLSVIDDLDELEAYINQNESPTIRKKKSVRTALRALDGKTVAWPYVHVETVGARSRWPWETPLAKYKLESATHFQTCQLRIKRRGHFSWRGVELGSGFEIELVYSKHVTKEGDIIGLGGDFDLTPALARFLKLNESLIHAGVHRLRYVLDDYRQSLQAEAQAKVDVLTYGFLTDIYNRPHLSPADVRSVVMDSESDLRVRQLMLGSDEALVSTHERIQMVSRSEITTWWYIFWDDLWRRNRDTISSLQTHAQDFNPYYPTSIAYRPLPRAALETFLIERGVLATKSKWQKSIHSGLLNKIYFRLNQIAFRSPDRVIFAHLGDSPTEVDLAEVEIGGETRSITTDAGGGTDHDDESIRVRPAFKWEGIFEDPVRTIYFFSRIMTRPLGMFPVWFGVTPLGRTRYWTRGVAFDVILSKGRYVLADTELMSDTEG
ncbi:hypothetical protein BOTBODRAFT_111078 [Botryobasidium botryosum FD-172 SS1]|uniref:Uncharacterized protein n=1 Tax=Botryobasidium botryosum (strain FD-172 SS1) TaxID=930990 RepID=A0A067MPD3_BOTB1|nr:hypothetical protein BOTBODRAFT_111078 [Botryobasidium botryosum FD-172 SS1]